MNITNIRIKPTDGTTSRKATVTIVFDNAFSFHGLSIVQRKDSEELFVSMPAIRNKKTGKYENVFYHPITKEAWQEISDKVLAAWEQVQANPEQQSIAMGDAEAAPQLGEVRIFEHNNVENPYVSASAVVDGGMLMSRIRIRTNQETGEKYIAMPGRPMGDGSIKDVYHPISSEAREALQSLVLQAYEEAMAKKDEQE